ncbi:hypothetical protein Aca07nite_16900 [Actinoplanes capillaceus]|uniref:Integral membrane protein n=1 Tax=Actinoplanes campanulatus TaxID=113559 RepID=A0ABQ3WDH8_9ACTN|nr:hypothetical protein [Actinoplanes capillaceus]GID44415.1 hypothetical protein Aca07nite_16900 [Actinoplanes capillaceus]
MSGRPLHAELTAVRALVADGLAEVGDAAGAGQVWLRSACTRLTSLDGVLIEAAGMIATPVWVVAVTAVTFVVVVLSAAVAEALGLGVAGVLAVSGTALLGTLATGPWAGRRVRVALGRRRLGPAPSPVRGAATLTEVPEHLLRARVRLVSAALRRAGADHWTAPHLRRAIRTDPVVRRLAHADLLLCQAIDCLDRHLGDLRKDMP